MNALLIGTAATGVLLAVVGFAWALVAGRQPDEPYDYE